MTFDQIEYFLMLAEEKSFVRAARRCGISQPSLTNAIKSLEVALGAPLFTRTAKGSELTVLGSEIRPLLLRFHNDRLRAVEFAHKFSRRPRTLARQNGRVISRSTATTPVSSLS